MSDWRKKAAPAKFRGVPFFVESGDQSGGRQTIAHEFPFSENPAYTEDLGLKSRDFSVEGYVLGTEYESARDALIKALETEGPGELVHPYFGTRRVAVVKFRVTQKRVDGGMAVFSIEFAETSTKAAAPTSTVDAAGLVSSKVAAAKTATKVQAVAGSSKAPFTGDYEAPASELGVLVGAIRAMESILDACPIEPALRAAFNRILDGQGGQAVEPPSGGFLYRPQYIAAVFESLFGGLATAIASTTAPIDRSALLLSLYAFNAGTRPPATTPNRIVERANFDSMQHLVQRFAIIFAAEAAASQTFVSYDDAVRVRSAIVEKIDQHVEAVTDDTFLALTDLRSALIEALPGPDSDLPRIQHYTSPTVVPSLVLAHRLYGNLDREEDVIRRNHLRHPGFVPADQSLEVLSDG